ncbi:MAG TPA: PQQ-binding-like beta-propeller repeat protein [Pirellulales bacterium]|jgi:outer membrane protein assembly factor BamB|nr:PQQ-binding-like beta-propeller repeat protein [Pirellulales bacterium]
MPRRCLALVNRASLLASQQWHTLFLALIAASIAFGVCRLGCTADAIAAVDLAGRDWPLVRGDAWASGVARSTLPDNLDAVWKFEVPKGGFAATPIVVEGMVYIGDLDGAFRAIDLASGKEHWKFTSQDGFNASAAVRNGLIYVGDTGGTFYCLDAATGKPKWSFKTEAEIDSSANFFKDTVLFDSQDATFYSLNAKSGKEAWRFKLEEQLRCSPTVVEDRAFLAGCDGKFHVVELNKGTEVGAVDIDSPTGSTPAVRGDAVYFGTQGGVFFAIDWKKATVLWKWTDANDAEIVSSAAVLPEEVIFASHRQVRALNPQSGKLLWKFATHGRADCSPVVVGDRVFFGGTDGRITALDRASGKKVWEYEAGGSFTGSPAVASNRILIASDDGIVYCLGAKTP